MQGFIASTGRSWLPCSELSTDNDQGELYLTDTVEMLTNAMHFEVADPDEVNGINNRKQLLTKPASNGFGTTGWTRGSPLSIPPAAP